MFFVDADGQWPLVEWCAYYPSRVYCSYNGDNIEDLPPTEVQGIVWLFVKDGLVRAYVENGCADDPTIYRIGDRELIGTMLPDEEWNVLEKTMYEAAVKRVAELRKNHAG